MITLEYKERNTAEELADLRKKGFVPAVFYGKKQASTPVTLSMSEFMKVWKQAGESGVVSLNSSQGSKPVDALIHEVSVDALTGRPIHVDFYVFEKGKKIEIAIPLEFDGVSPAVKDLGGSLIKVLHELKVSASPEHLPHSLTVDISSLATFDDVITAAQIKLPAGVELAENPEEVVASAAAPKDEEVEESAPIDLSAIEVEKKGKKEEEAPAE